jgi:hypothetical protein
MVDAPETPTWRKRWKHQSLWVTFVIEGVLFGGLFFLGTLGLNSRTPVVISLISCVVAGLLFATGMTAWIAHYRKRYGGTNSAELINHAIKTRSLPPDADASIWLPLIERKQREYARLRWLGPVGFAAFAVAAAALALTTSGTERWVMWACSLGLVGIAIAYVVSVPKTLVSLGILRSELDDSATEIS